MIRTYLMRRNIKVWNPFKLWKMTTLIERKDGSKFTRSFKRFEYVGQETEEGIVIAIYFVEVEGKTKRESKYEKLYKKWR